MGSYFRAGPNIEKDFGGIERLMTLAHLGGWWLRSSGRDFAKIFKQFNYNKSYTSIKREFIAKAQRHIPTLRGASRGERLLCVLLPPDHPARSGHLPAPSSLAEDH